MKLTKSKPFFYLVTSLSLGFLYLLTRLVNLRIIPIFTDEAIYSYWAQVALNDPVHRFISLTDGKQPLFIWMAAVFQHFVNDPLIATRLVSVLAGAFSLFGIYLLAKLLFSEKEAGVAALLYLFLPFTLLYDRMALYDSLLAAISIWSTYLAIRMARSPRLDLAMINGIVIGLGLITKSSAFFFLALLPTSLLFFDFRSEAKFKNLAKWVLLSVLTTLMSEVMYNALRLSPYFYIINQKNHEFIRSIHEVMLNPFFQFKSNSFAMAGWIVGYIGWPLFSIFVLGTAYLLFKRNLKLTYLLILIMVPFLAESIFNKILYPRFLLFFFPYIIVAISASLIEMQKLVKNKYLLSLLILISLAMPLLASFNIIINPPNAKIPHSDASQYISDWPAGYGVNNVVDYLNQQSTNQEVNIGTEGTFGLYPFALNIYFYKNTKVHVYSFWPVDPNILPAQIMNLAKKQKTFFVFNENQKPITNPQLNLLSKYQKGNGNSYMRLYEISPH